MPDPILSRLIGQPCPLAPGSRILTYARDSGGEDQERSVDEQIRLYDAYADHFGLVIIRHFHDRARPGSSLVGREGLEHLLEEARRDPRPAEGILFWALDRLSRNQLEAQYLKSDLRLRGYTLIFLSNDIPDAGDMTPIFEAFYEWKAAEDLKTISRNARRGLADLVTTRKPDGSYEGFMPGIPPRGFKGEPVQIGVKRSGKPRVVQRWIPDPSTWARCRQAWELRASGATVPEIEKKLYLFAFCSCYSTFFRNAIYKGELHYGMMVLPAFVPPMVDEETWNAVQKMNHQRKKRYGWDPRRAGSAHLLSGLIFCKVCGSPMKAHVDRRRGGNRRTYVCIARERARTCRAKAVPADLIEGAVVDRLCETVLTRDNLRRMADLLHRSQEKESLEARQAGEGIRNRLRELDQAIANLVRSAEQAPLSSALARTLEEREQERDRLQEEKASLENLQSFHRAPRYTDAELADLGARMRAGLRAGGPEARRVLAGFVLRIDAERRGAKLTYTFPLDKKTAGQGGSSKIHPSGSAPEAVSPIGCLEVSWRITFPRRDSRR
jgi:DNA invertase Pin-like site-specific DNA recombinase